MKWIEQRICRHEYQGKKPDTLQIDVWLKDDEMPSEMLLTVYDA